jgi:hypothetical protein
MDAEQHGGNAPVGAKSLVLGYRKTFIRESLQIDFGVITGYLIMKLAKQYMRKIR